MSFNLKDSNYYDILEVAHNASQREIHEAFKRAKATYSNDNPALYSMFTREEAQELLKIIEEAYHVLGDHKSRQAYDLQLREHQAQWGRQPSAMAPPSPPTPPAPPTPPVMNQSSKQQESKDESRWKETSVRFDDGSSYMVRTRVREEDNPNQGKTQFGTYQINPEFEKEIATRDIFDGAFLKRIREYKKLTLDDMIAATRVSRTYLMAVEEMDPRNLPAPVFVRGFVVHMARVLQLNEKNVADSYMKLFKQQTNPK